MNNIEVASVTSDAYSDCFGFTEQEVKDALKCQNIDTMREAKAMYPLNEEDDAFILEFKVLDERKEKSLEETAESAFRQIEEKCYETDLLAAGISKNRIFKLGFAFKGKDVLVISRP